MNQKYTLDMLTSDYVSVKTQDYTSVDGIDYPIGQPHRRRYYNSEIGRVRVEDELPEEQQNAIFAVWGDAPTVDNNNMTT